jgi:hypothetical protein
MFCRNFTVVWHERFFLQIHISTCVIWTTNHYHISSHTDVGIVTKPENASTAIITVSNQHKISKYHQISKSAKAIQKNWKSTIIFGISKLLDTHYFNTQIQKMDTKISFYFSDSHVNKRKGVFSYHFR